MKDKFFIPGVIVGVLLFFSVLPRHCLALDFLDGRLRIKGSLYEFMIYRTSFNPDERQYYRDTKWGLMRTKGTLELLYKAVENEKLLVNLFGFFQYWHESVPDFDNKYRRSIAPQDRKKY
ncbi:MAG: hypothetical protein NTY29_05390, partial [Proteobacteria bacterium]|nr:hypothetical protein [Pseudomonadota bacterium]